MQLRFDDTLINAKAFLTCL